MSLLDTFAAAGYANGVGRGVYDVHSPAPPTAGTIEALSREAVAALSPEQVWVNPDCGLETRRWKEVRPAIRATVRTAERVRRSLASARAEHTDARAGRRHTGSRSVGSEA